MTIELPEEALSAIRRAHAIIPVAPANDGPQAPWFWATAHDIAKEPPPIPWLCEALAIAPGMCTIFSGSGYSRKTLALQSMALSVAAGLPLWGLFPVRSGKVLHFDYEQGSRLTFERYQRMANGMGIALTTLPQDALRVSALPRLYLEAPGAFEHVERAADGCALAIVDSFKAAHPKAEENSSDVREHIDRLSRVSERTACAFLIIHHERKPSGNDGGEAKHDMRGSGAFFDACQTHFSFKGAKGKPTTVKHEKDRLRGVELEDFLLDALDLEGPDGEGPRWGLRVFLQDAQAVKETVTRETEREIDAKVIAFLTANAGVYHGGLQDLRALVKGGNQTAFTNRITVLVHENKLSRSKRPGRAWLALKGREPDDV